MTGPHLTPEREAEIRERVERRALTGGGGSYDGEDMRVVFAALDAERAAHAQTRTALTESTAALVVAARQARWDGRETVARDFDAQVQANQVALQLAVAEADKPHHGNER